ncbi:hypothetical protein ES703_107282 [subsurface metagenome]
MVGWRLRQGPRAVEFSQEVLSDVGRITPEGVEPILESLHLGVPGHADVELCVASETC